MRVSFTQVCVSHVLQWCPDLLKLSPSYNIRPPLSSEIQLGKKDSYCHSQKDDFSWCLRWILRERIAWLDAKQEETAACSLNTFTSFLIFFSKSNITVLAAQVGS